ncbi:hypothetical protein AgCh_031665 [Apium graveolens]
MRVTNYHRSKWLRDENNADCDARIRKNGNYPPSTDEDFGDKGKRVAGVQDSHIVNKNFKILDINLGGNGGNNSNKLLQIRDIDCGPGEEEINGFGLEDRKRRGSGPHTREIAAMADSFIPVSADHSEPSVGAPTSDPRPVIPPALAILPPPVLQPVPLQAIPPPGMRPPVRGPPPADSGSTERLGVVRGDLERGYRRFVGTTAVRIAEATHEDITPDFLVEWAKWVLEKLEEIGGPDLP